MAYAQIHTQAFRHPKVAALSDAAFRLWVAGLAHCQELLTDGLIHVSVLHSLGVRYHGRLVQELATADLWEPLEDRTGWRVHDYLAWNDSKENIEKRRERWRLKKQGKPPSFPGGSTPGSTLQIPSTETLRDVTKDSENTKRSLTRETRFVRFWEAYPKKVGRGEAFKVWTRLKASDVLTDLIVAALGTQRTSPGWTKEHGKFIPDPAKWLRQERWNDELSEPDDRDKSGISIGRGQCPHDPPCRSTTACIALTLEQGRAERAATT